MASSKTFQMLLNVLAVLSGVAVLLAAASKVAHASPVLGTAHQPDFVEPAELFASLRGARRGLTQDGGGGDSGGGGGGGDGGGGGGPAPIYPHTHGWMAAIFLGTLPALSWVFARRMKHREVNVWFQVHRALGILIFAGGVVAISLGIYIGDCPAKGNLETTHETFGLIILAFICLQASAAIMRPNKNSPLRMVWNVVHWWTGRAVMAMAIANVFMGLTLSGESTKYYIIYGVIIGVILLSWFIQEDWMWIAGSRAVQDSSGGGAAYGTDADPNGGMLTNGFSDANGSMLGNRTRSYDIERTGSKKLGAANGNTATAGMTDVDMGSPSGGMNRRVSGDLLRRRGSVEMPQM